MSKRGNSSLLKTKWQVDRCMKTLLTLTNYFEEVLKKQSQGEKRQINPRWYAF